ncbi:MAG TPA: hypothetical protein PLO63_13520 [Syntrophales bacterium]|nr:hypothetical protein [Syntrophales bacterium]
MAGMKDRAASEEPRLAGARELVPVRDKALAQGITIADVLGRFMRG